LRILIVGIPISGYTFFFAEPTYRFLIKEDGIYENLTAVCLLLMATILFISIFYQPGSVPQRIYKLGLAAVLFFGFGEEISWGQRLFSVESSQFFQQYNAQGETNLHNLKVGDVKLNKVLFSWGMTLFTLAYYGLLPWLYRRSQWVKREVSKWKVAVPRWNQSLLLLLAFLLVLMIPDGKKWELSETSFVLTFFLVLLHPLNTEAKPLRRRTYEPVAA
jgi:hypothetical protein